MGAKLDGWQVGSFSAQEQLLHLSKNMVVIG